MPPEVAAPRPPQDPIKETLNALPGKQRAILSMFYVDGFSVREISAVLDVKEGTVKSRLFHARHSLRKALEAERKRTEVPNETERT
jgi:RNA polymerase sigma-70 factor (ECF subfamily)